MKKILIISALTTACIFCSEKTRSVQKDFDDIQRILSITTQIAKDVICDARTNVHSVQNGPTDWPEPKPSSYHTREGLRISISDYPHHLDTRWGEVKIYGGCSRRSEEFSRLNGCDLMTLMLAQRLKLKFVGTRQQFYTPNEFYELTSTQKIAIPSNDVEEVINKALDSNRLILSNYGQSIFEIEAIDGVPCNKVDADPSTNEYRNRHKFLWTLRALFKGMPLDMFLENCKRSPSLIKDWKERSKSLPQAESLSQVEYLKDAPSAYDLKALQQSVRNAQS